ncbi:histidine kinase [Aquimarina gracilis]
MVSYTLAYYLVPKYIVSKSKWPYVLYSVVLFYLASVFARVLIIYISEPLLRKGPFVKEPILEIILDWKKLLIEYVPPVLLVVMAFLFLKLFVHYTKTKQKELTLKKEKVESELRILKSQLNPHFLFNTLNNIYALAVDNSPKTAFSIERLSEILDYILYRCSEKYVSLYEEIRMLESYIELEKLRYDDRLQLTFKKDIERDIEIAPLLLLSFVENAFKHGAGEDSGAPRIDIKIAYQNELFLFEISNTIQTITIDKSRKKIGLENITKQLDLLYPDQYTLAIDNTEENLFVVCLKISTQDEN